MIFSAKSCNVKLQHRHTLPNFCWGFGAGVISPSMPQSTGSPPGVPYCMPYPPLAHGHPDYAPGFYNQVRCIPVQLAPSSRTEGPAMKASRCMQYGSFPP